ncbi:hypothetical protein N8459_02520 [Nitrosopumilus sp.]|nr:hypothetical protein [Nitrosopumilus sp.]
MLARFNYNPLIKLNITSTPLLTTSSSVEIKSNILINEYNNNNNNNIINNNMTYNNNNTQSIFNKKHNIHYILSQLFNNSWSFTLSDLTNEPVIFNANSFQNNQSIKNSLIANSIYCTEINETNEYISIIKLIYFICKHLEPDGTLVFKMKDTYSNKMIELLFVLNCIFKNINIYRHLENMHEISNHTYKMNQFPNKYCEKWIVCNKFDVNNTTKTYYYNKFMEIDRILFNINYNTNNSLSILENPIPLLFTNKINEMNVILSNIFMSQLLINTNMSL